jgi:hypothetical protein
VIELLRSSDHILPTGGGDGIMAGHDLYWSGASGKKYGYWNYQLPFSCDPGQNGNYIFTRIINNVWLPIYIGQGDINDRVNDETHYSCPIEKGATHVHVHTNSIEKDRIAEEQDLLAGHPQAYEPTGCNEKPGG